jgi:F0F1-type ATP synthase membrane subunit b/b'
LICPSCGHVHDDADNFCPRCGRIPGKKAPYSDFELGRIAALDTIRNDFWTRFLRWASLGALLLALLAYFGVNDIIRTKVSDAVNERINSIQQRITEASTRSIETSAKADLEIKKVESMLADLETRKNRLDASIVEAEGKKGELENAVDQLGAQKKQMSEGIVDLRRQELELKHIIESENLSTIFAELRRDHYRVRTLKARVTIEYIQLPPNTTVQFNLNSISLTRTATDKGPPRVENVVQFYVGHPLNLMNQSTNTPGALITYEMFELYEQMLLNHSMKNLSGIDKLVLEFGPIIPSPPATLDSILKDLRQLLSIIKSLTVDVELNGTLLNHYVFSKEELQLPPDQSTIVMNGAVKFDITKDISGSLKDVPTLYDTNLKSSRD